MLWAPPPITSTEPPGRSRRAGATARQASARLSLAAATRSGSTPWGTRTSMWSAYGTRRESATIPPHGPEVAPNPNAARVAPGLWATAVEHFAVNPRRHSVQVPHDTAQGTTTTSPTLSLATSSPTSMTWAMHSWPIANGPWKGTEPDDRGHGRVDQPRLESRLQRARDGPVDRQGVPVAAAGDEGPHQRVGAALQPGIRAVSPLQPTGSDQGQLTHGDTLSVAGRAGVGSWGRPGVGSWGRAGRFPRVLRSFEGPLPGRTVEPWPNISSSSTSHTATTSLRCSTPSGPSRPAPS